MNIDVKFSFFLSLCLLIICAGSGAAQTHALFYPDSLIVLLGINAQDIVKNQKNFKNDPIHTQWMEHVHSTIPGINPDKEDAIIKTHTSLLFIKDKLDKAYFSGNINNQEFTTRLAELMKWFQASNRSVLSEKESNALFGISGQDEEKSAAQGSDGKLGFPIINPKTTADMIKKSFNDALIRDITLFYQDHARELRDIKEIYETEEFRGEEAKQIKNDMQRTERELQTAFMNYCRDVLSDDQFKLLFGSQKNK